MPDALKPLRVHTHIQPGGETCETAHLIDGRTIRVIGFGRTHSPTRELARWLLWLGIDLNGVDLRGTSPKRAPRATKKA